MGNKLHTASVWRDEDQMPAINETARRCLNLFFVLNSAARPLSTEQIIDDSDLGYGTGNRASDKKTFQRDRKRLAEQGIIIRGVKTDGSSENEESGWEIDRKASEFGASGTTREDLEQLLTVTDRYLHDHAPFPGRDAVARIDAKIRGELSRRGIGVDAASISPMEVPETYRYSTINEQLWSCYCNRKTAVFDYQNAQGCVSERIVAIYGIFNLDGKAYFVGREHASGSVKTFRSDRVAAVRKPGAAYAIPGDFRIGDYLFLPFDFAPNQPVAATFSFSKEAPEQEIRTLTHGRGTLDQQEDGTWRWSVDVNDLDAAASLTCSYARLGMKPIAPDSLVATWEERIRRAVEANAQY